MKNMLSMNMANAEAVNFTKTRNVTQTQYGKYGILAKKWKCHVTTSRVEDVVVLNFNVLLRADPTVISSGF